jgi:tripartite-type tricarboxylate transporter receptor subunit TctC
MEFCVKGQTTIRRDSWRAAFLTALCLLAFAVITPRQVRAQAAAYPNKPIKLVVPYAAGQGTDVAARYIADLLSKALGQNVFVENKPGAGGNIGTLQVAKAPADGYTLLMGTNGTHAAAPFLYPNLGFDPEADFEAVVMTGVLPLAFATAPGNPIDTIPKLIAAAKARPDKINVAYTTTTSRATLELFKMQAKAPLYGVPYKGSAQALTDVMGGQIEFMADTVASIRAHVASGKLKALGITTPSSSELLPGVKSVAEQGVSGYAISGWNVIFAPKGIPTEALRLIAAETMKIMALPETKQKLLQMGADPRAMSGSELQGFLKSERETWGNVIRAANIKID